MFRATRSRWAHPRRCGADTAPTRLLPVDPGSSPQVRGRRIHRAVHRPRPGLIPAGAGQTLPARGFRRFRWAHPRRCGADERDITPAGLGEGSSPQVRGRRSRLTGGWWRRGLIPAGAGQTSVATTATSETEAHPRRCGADMIVGSGLTREPGSSPQVRGRLPAPARALVSPGLIPAGAGQTRLRSCCAAFSRAHPRRCGADVQASRTVVACGGLIPAGAGQTGCPAWPGGRRWAHPRRCGADWVCDSVSGAAGGSSPQVRGRRLVTSGAVWATGAHPRRCGADPWRPATLHWSKGI